MKFYELDSTPAESTRYTSGFHAGYTWSLSCPVCPLCDEEACTPEAEPGLERLEFSGGPGRGPFEHILVHNPWQVLIRREALEQLQAEGLRGLEGRRTDLRFREENAPELLELKSELHGLYHPDCEPPVELVRCEACDRYRFNRPKKPLLDAASLPEHLDVFRLRNGTATLVITERFARTLQRLGFEEFSLRELPVR
jgi:uncharacterized double-CXXCG motif protein